MSLIIKNMNTISETYQQKVIKVWSYNVEMTPEKLLNPHYQNQVVRYIACVHEKNPINDNEFKYISMIDTNNSQVSFQLFEDADIKTRLKHADWLKNNFIPIACMPENVDYNLGLHYVRLLNGRTLIIPHAVCPELLDKKINEISLILLTEDFCQKNEII